MFELLADKIKSANVIKEPFEHVKIECFLEADDLIQLLAEDTIKSTRATNVEQLAQMITATGGQIYRRAGCMDSVSAYLDIREGRSENFSPVARQPDNAGLVTSAGLGFRMPTDRPKICAKLFDVLNGHQFLDALKAKFEISETVSHNAGIYKFFSGYQIPPHPDSCRKGVTYLLNLTPKEQCQPGLGTKLHRLKERYKSVEDYWNAHPDVDRCWLPWDWVETIYEIYEHNTFYAFKPGTDTIHSVNIEYDHLSFQRTSIVGNLWREDQLDKKPGSYLEIKKWLERKRAT